MTSKFSLALVVLMMLGQASGQEPGDVIFPIVVNGALESPHFQTSFVFFNRSTTAQEIFVEGFRDSFGGPSQLFCAEPIHVTPPFDPSLRAFGRLPESGILRLTSSGESEELFTGWAIARLENPDQVEASAELSILAFRPDRCPQTDPRDPVPVTLRRSTRIRETVQVPAVRPAPEFVGEAVITGARETAFAIVNPSPDQPALIQFELLDESGMPLADNAGGPDAFCPPSFSLPARTRLAGTAWSLYAAELLALPPGLSPCFIPGGRPRDFSGTARMTSDSPIAVAGVHVLLPEGKLVAAPVSRLETRPEP